MSEGGGPVGNHYHFSDPIIIKKQTVTKVKLDDEELLGREQSALTRRPKAHFRPIHRTGSMNGRTKVIGIYVGQKLIRRLSPEEAKELAEELLKGAERGEAFLKNLTDERT